ncbi:hypothetical protein [Amycolatopsis sp. NPDC001319]|uniref:hypothetical protein n=1 Tax=unclassified Amycolatopsis TaxID=2618356 RepID=UPI0036C18960
MTAAVVFVVAEEFFGVFALDVASEGEAGGDSGGQDTGGLEDPGGREVGHAASAGDAAAVALVQDDAGGVAAADGEGRQIDAIRHDDGRETHRQDLHRRTKK